MARTAAGTLVRMLRQPRYATLGALMVIVAIGCVAAGTWQISRFEQKRHENDGLRRNARIALTGVANVLPLVGARPPPPGQAQVEFRRVVARGAYDLTRQSLVRSRTLDDTVGFLVLTPLQTSDGVVLTVRGFVAVSSTGGPPVVPAPPTGSVRIIGRTQASERGDDQARSLTGGQVQTINPRQQQARLGAPVFDGFVQLETGQPGSGGLQTLPRPDLSNPAGGALEPQHFAYVIQWYLFAILALAAPFAMARSETKQRASAEIDAVEDVEAPADDDQVRAAKLADRYGRTFR